MRQHRGPLLLILLAVILVSGGYASPIRQSAINRDFGFQSTYAISSSTSTDNWLGGTGNWSDSGGWDSGLPSAGSDVVIYSGGDDLVYLDMNASIASLTLGGADGGSAWLSDNGTAQTLTIAGALTIGRTGVLALGTGSTVTVGGAMNNSGGLMLGGSQAQFGTLVNTGSINITDGTLTVNGDLQSAGLEGLIEMDGNSKLVIGGSFTNSAMFMMTSGTFLINGDLTNTSIGVMNLQGQVAVGGTVTNSGWFDIWDSSSGHPVFASLVNSGSIYTHEPGVFSVVGDVTNSGLISDTVEYAGRSFSVGGNLNNSGEIYTGFDVRGNVNNSRFVAIGSGTVGGNVINSGMFSVYNIYDVPDMYVAIQGNFENSNYVGLSYNAIVDVGGRLLNTPTGTLYVGIDGSNYSNSNVLNVASMVNQGTVIISDPGAGYSNVLNVNGGPHAGASALSGFVNTGNVDIRSNGNLNVVGNYTQTAGQTKISGNLQVQGQGRVNFAGGTVFGNGGTITGPVFSNAAINIGDQLLSVGQFTFLGNYTQGPKGSLTFDIAGKGPGEFDQLNISGQARLNGLMTVGLVDGFVPQLGDDFDIMHFASESGKFSMVLGLPINGQEHFVLEHNPTDLTLDVVSGGLLGADSGQPVVIASNIASDGVSEIPSGTASTITSDYGRSSPTPEPGTLLLLGSGLMCVGYAVRRRMEK
jgi:autotransporter family porin